MGTVYLALDTKLERRVALKLLRIPAADASASARAAERLLREARAAALIEHPNAVAVYDVGEVNDTPYIAMEVVVGRSLRACVGDASVPLDMRLAWLADVARTLVAAHARGVVHRDVKPENVMVREDGAIKVLDFGIAWTAGSAAAPLLPLGLPADDKSGSSSIQSAEGVYVGTPRYMSPELFDGREPDGRADQFAWGVMAYELLAGAPPWSGEGRSLSTVFDAVERQAVPLRKLQPAISPEVERIVHRAMAKDPADRFPSMSAVVTALDAVRARRRRRWRSARWVIAGIAVVALAGVVVALRAARAPADAPSFHAGNVRRITFSDACEEYPSFTPDGRSVVFDQVARLNVVIVQQDIATGAQKTLTDVDGWDLGAQVSPDGKQLAFLRAPHDGASGAMIADFDGSRPPRFVSSGWLRPSFSPDGTALWCGEQDHPKRLEIATGKVTRTLDMPRSALASIARETREGRVVVLVTGTGPTSTQGLALFDRAGTMQWLTHDRLEEALDLTPDERFAVTSRLTPTGNRELVSVSLQGGASTAMAGADIAPAQGLRFSPDGRLLAWSMCHEVTELVRVDTAGALVPLHRLHAWKETAAAAIPGTPRLVVLSDRDGAIAPWVVDRDESDTPRKLLLPGTPRSVGVSPDGHLAAFGVVEHGIVIAPLDGGPATALTTDDTDDKPRFQRDGRSVVFTRAVRGASRRVFSVDLGGGPARALLEDGSSDAAPSPADARMAYLQGAEVTKKIPMVFDASTGRSRRLSPDLGEGAYESVAFSEDGKRVGLFAGAAGNSIVEVDAATGAVLRTIDAGMSSLFKLSYDGGQLIAARSKYVGNLWLADRTF